MEAYPFGATNWHDIISPGSELKGISCLLHVFLFERGLISADIGEFLDFINCFSEYMCTSRTSFFVCRIEEKLNRCL
jgi:hypothetical protein